MPRGYTFDKEELTKVISPLTKNQWMAVIKAIVYSFVSTFIVTVVVNPTLTRAALYAAAVAGVNASLVTIKKLFTVE